MLDPATVYNVSIHSAETRYHDLLRKAEVERKLTRGRPAETRHALLNAVRFLIWLILGMH